MLASVSIGLHVATAMPIGRRLDSLLLARQNLGLARCARFPREESHRKIRAICDQSGGPVTAPSLVKPSNSTP